MTYTVILEWDEEDGVYNVSVPAFPGCFAWGRSKREALERIREVISMFLEDMIENGETPPKEADIRRVRVS